MQRYAVIDGAQRPHFHERLERLGATYCSLFDGQAEESLKEIAPLLVEYAEHDVNPGLSKEIERLGALKPAVSVLGSDLGLHELARHFRDFHLVKVPEQGGRDMLLRWYDTRILPAWSDLLTALQQAAFFKGIRQWRYFDRFGDMQELALPVSSPDTLPALPPLRLDQEQYAHLLDACEPDVAIAQLRRVIPDEVRRVPARTLYPFVSAHLDDSRAHGVQQLDDHVQYLLLALYTSGGFGRHPAVAERLARPCDQWPQPFSEWVAALPENVWESGSPLWESPPGPASAQRVTELPV